VTDCPFFPLSRGRDATIPEIDNVRGPHPRGVYEYYIGGKKPLRRRRAVADAGACFLSPFLGVGLATWPSGQDRAGDNRRSSAGPSRHGRRAGVRQLLDIRFWAADHGDRHEIAQAG